MRTALWFGALLVVLMLDIAASVRVGRWEAITSAQKAAWLLLVWVIPLLGASLALHVSSEVSGGLPTGQSSGVGIGDAGSPDVGGDGGGGH